MHPIFLSTQDKPCICTDNPDHCKFRCSDPASLLRHRIRSHGYVPKSQALASESVRSSTPVAGPSVCGEVDSPNPPPSRSLLPPPPCDTDAEPDMEIPHTDSESDIFCHWPSLSEPELHTDHYWDNLNFRSHYDAQILKLLDHTFLNPNNS